MEFLNRIFKGDKVLWIVFMLLCLISVIEVFSAASMLTYNAENYWSPIRSHCVNLLLGVCVVYIAHLIPYQFYKAFPLVLVPASILMLVWVLFKGAKINDAARWITLGGLNVQPSEVAKVAVIMATALILSRTQGEKGANDKAFKWILSIVLISCGLIAPENLSTAVLLFAVVYVMMFVGRVPMRQLLKLTAVLIVAGAAFLSIMLFVPKQTLESVPVLDRFTTWQARIKSFRGGPAVPAAKYVVSDKNFQETHANIAIASSNVLGCGPGNSVERDYLPQAYSDFIFAIIIEELGLVGGAIVVLLYLILLFRAIKIAQRCDRHFPAFLVLGCALMLVSQAMINMMVAVGLFPVTGQPLPLISRGGTATLINCGYIGMMLSVSCYVQKIQNKEVDSEENVPQLLREENEQ